MPRFGQFTRAASKRYGPASLATMVAMPAPKFQAPTTTSDSRPVGPLLRRSVKPGCAPSFIVSMSWRDRATLHRRGLSILPLYLPAKTTPDGSDEAASGSSGASAST